MDKSTNCKNVVLTGGNSGVGYETVKYLFSNGYNVIFGARNVQKNQEAIKTILQERKSEQQTNWIKSFPLDLSKRQSILQFAQFAKKQFNQHIDILINNAGLTTQTLTLNQDKIQHTLAVNHFGHFYLTYLLFDSIKKSQEPRIINVSSMMHFKSPDPILEDIACANKSYDIILQYNISKMMNVIFTQQLYRRTRTQNSNILSVVLHPGFVYTNFGSDVPTIKNMIESMKHLTIPPTQGARTSIYLATQSVDKIKNGQYYNDKAQFQQMDPRARDQKIAEQLWKMSEQVYGIQFL